MIDLQIARVNHLLGKCAQLPGRILESPVHYRAGGLLLGTGFSVRWISQVTLQYTCYSSATYLAYDYTRDVLERQ